MPQHVSQNASTDLSQASCPPASEFLNSSDFFKIGSTLIGTSHLGLAGSLLVDPGGDSAITWAGAVLGIAAGAALSAWDLASIRRPLQKHDS